MRPCAAPVWSAVVRVCPARATADESGRGGWCRSAAAAPPDRDRLAVRGGGAHRGEVPGGAAVERLAQGVVGGRQLLLELRDPALERVDVVLELEDPADALEADAGRGQLRDLPEQLDVAPGVAPAAAAGATGADQPEPVVGAEGLRVQAGQLGGHADDVDRHLGARGAARPGGHDELPRVLASNRFARRSEAPAASRSASTAARDFSSRWAGTCTSTVTSRSPVCPSLRCTPRPRTRKERPLGVPGGIFKVTGAPPRVGTLMSAPSAASAKLTGTVSVRLSPLRPNSGCGATLTLT